MNTLKSCCILILLFGLTGCGYITDNLIQSFRTINHSIQLSNDSLRVENKLLTSQIHVAKIKQRTTIADSSLLLENDIDKLIESAKKQLVAQDPEGQNIDIADKILNTTATASSLNQKLSFYYSFVLSNLSDTNDLKKINNIIISNRKVSRSNELFATKLMGIPSAAMITTLSKYQSDCLVAQNIVLRQIKK